MKKQPSSFPIFVLLYITHILVKADQIPCGVSDNKTLYCDDATERCCEESSQLCCSNTDNNISFSNNIEDLSNTDDGADDDDNDKTYGYGSIRYWYDKWYFWVGVLGLHLVAVILLFLRLRRNRKAGIPFSRMHDNSNSRQDAQLPPQHNRHDNIVPSSYAPNPIRRDTEATGTVEAIIMYG